MEKILDLRVQKTYESLNKAFLDLIEEKDFEKISVNELCQKAKIRRPTFYKHFLDKYDYLKFFVQSILENYFSRAAQLTPQDDPRSFFYNLFAILTEEMEQYQHLRFKINMTPSMMMELESLKVHFESKMSQQFLLTTLADEKARMDMELHTQLVLFNLIHLSIWWIEHQDRISKEEISLKAQEVIDKLLG